MTHREEHEKLISAFPWAASLPPTQLDAFAAEVTAWRKTAEIHADPELYRTLTAPLDGADHGPVRFYEDDESAEEVVAAFDQGEKGVTAELTDDEAGRGR